MFCCGQYVWVNLLWIFTFLSFMLHQVDWNQGPISWRLKLSQLSLCIRFKPKPDLNLFMKSGNNSLCVGSGYSINQNGSVTKLTPFTKPKLHKWINGLKNEKFIQYFTIFTNMSYFLRQKRRNIVSRMRSIAHVQFFNPFNPSPFLFLTILL